MNRFVTLYLIFLLGVEAFLSSTRPQQYTTTQNENTFTDTADRLYVIESNLSIMPGLFGKLSHTGLLVKSKGKDIYTIIEYMDDGQVWVRPIYLSNSEITIFKEGKNKWKKEQYGVVVNNLTIGAIQSTMEKLGGLRKYKITDHNCHIVQEATRYVLNLLGTYKIRYPKEANELISYGRRMRIEL